MRVARLSLVILPAVILFLGMRPFAPQATTTGAPTLQQFLSPASPQELVAATKVDRVAWISYQEGRRNAYVASAPAFVPVKLTNFPNDDGVDMTHVEISADGNTVTFIRGASENRDGWSADPSGNPNGTDRSIWAARVSAPGAAWKVVDLDGNNYELAPDGSSVIFAKDGQIYRALVTPTRPDSEMDRGEKPFIKEWGSNGMPAATAGRGGGGGGGFGGGGNALSWSPDGKKIAYVSYREDHSLVVVYDMATRTVTYLSPSVDRDTSPVWSADSRQVIFVRQPGVPFGQQSQQGAGQFQPAGPAFTGTTGARGGAAAAAEAGAGQGRGRGNAAANPNVPESAREIPGLVTAKFRGGYDYSLWIADVATGQAHEIWNNAGERQTMPQPAGFRWEGGVLVYRGGGGRGGRGGPGGAGGRRGGGPQLKEPVPAFSDTVAVLRPTPPPSGPPGSPTDEWDRYYSLDVSQPNATPVLLTTTNGLIEDATSVTYSADGKTMFYCTNANDIERRHIWAVPTTGGEPRQITSGEGIETYPAVLASGKTLATLSASWNMPQSLGIWKIGPTTDTTQKIAFPTSRPGFPVDAHVKPEIVLTEAADGLQIHNQLFLPKNIRPGERRPAMVFVHGGPVRQMLPAYHYMQVYHWFYGVNEWLASQGYVVLSVNYRSGIGYGNSFRNAPNTEARGNSEYQDVYAGAKYLQSRPDVDPNRIGIWGLSYGGLLTAQALARNSDIFKVGADFAGVHLYGNSLNPDDLSYESSSISQIDHWTSPVYLVQGDDDRNVAFSQMVGLVQLLRQRNVDFELTVFPDDVHESLLHHRWIQALNGMSDFLQKYLGPTTGAAAATSDK